VRAPYDRNDDIDTYRGLSLRWIRNLTRRDIPRALSCQSLMDAHPDRLHEDIHLGDVVLMPAETVVLSTSGEKTSIHGDCGLVVGAKSRKFLGEIVTDHWLVLRLTPWRGPDVVAIDCPDMRAFR
jgi:hypothetical protein